MPTTTMPCSSRRRLTGLFALGLLVAGVCATSLLFGGARGASAAVVPANGYWLTGSDGGIFAFGDAVFFGSTGSAKLNQPVVGMAATPTGRGYWLVASDGGIFAFGDAGFFGSTGGMPLNKPVVGMAATPTGRGYWLVASDGGIFAFGDAGFFGSTGSTKLNKPVVGMAATPTGRGYWLVASDGGIFAFGDAGFFGSTGGVPLNRPIVGMAATPTSRGYWLVASDGGIFAFGDAGFFGSTGSTKLNKPVVGMAATPTGRGYWLVASDGGLFAFGDAGFFGSTGGLTLNKPLVGMAPTVRSRSFNAPTDIVLSKSTVAENQPTATAVGTLSATDSDSGDSHTFSLVPGAGSADNASFELVGSTLSTKQSFDFETKNSYSIRVRTTDLLGATFERSLTITITDVDENRAPTNISLSSSSVAESQPAGTTVGSLSSTDPDPGDTHTYSLVTGTGDTDNASVQIVGTTLRTAVVLDFETMPSLSIRVRSDDGRGGTFSGSLTITVTNDNDAPAVTTSGGSTPYTENGAPVVIDGGLSAADVDDINLEAATVRVSVGFDASDTLGFTNQSGITGAYNAGTGVLTLTGTSTVANYQTALRAITFASTNDNPALAKTIEFKVNDGSADSSLATKAIAVTPVSDAPIVATTAAPLAYTENAGPVAIDPGLTATDADSTQLSAATVTVQTNFVPAQDDLAFADQLGITGSYNDTIGTLTLTGPTTVANYQTALRSVTYINVSDGPAPPTRTIAFQVIDDLSTVSNIVTRGITITSVNDAPTAVNDTGTTDEDTTLNVGAPGVLANDSDLDPGDTNTVMLLNGSATLTGTSVDGAVVTINADGSYTYNPSSIFQALSTGQTDTDSFTYTMADGAGAPSTATVNLTINGVSDAPTATADSFDAIGNTGLFVGTTRPANEAGKEITGSVLANDTDPDTLQANLVAELVTNAATTLGGTITIESDGNFTYQPDDVDTAVTDTFTYRVCDASPCNSGTVANATGTVSLPISNQVWYVRNNAAAGGDGTSDTPFDTLAEAETASSVSDSVYVFDGDDTSTNLDTGYLMQANERLLGEHSGISLDPDDGGPLDVQILHPGTPSAYPTLTTTAAEDVVTLAATSTIDGFNIDPGGAGGGVGGGTGSGAGAQAAGDVTIANLNIVDAGSAGIEAGLELNTTTGTNNISNLVVNNGGGGAAAIGVRLINAGTVNFASAGTISITTVGAKGLETSNTNMGAGSVFDDITVTGSGSGGVAMATTSGTTALGDGSGTDLSLTTTSGASAAFSLANNTGTITVDAGGTDNLSATGGPAVDLTGTPNASLSFDVVSSTASSADGIGITGLGAGTFSATSGTIAGATDKAVDIDGGGGAITYPGALNDGPGQAAEITNRTSGAISLNGSIADGADAGGGIALAGNTGGSTTFSGSSKVLNTNGGSAVAMSTSDGHTLTLSGGGLNIDTTSGAGLAATTSGTLIVQGASNTIDTTTGTALNVVDTDIGAGGLNFLSIAANGAPSGIVFTNTGSTAGLTVAGSGSALPGGDDSGGVIQNTTGPGVSLTNTLSPAFNNMNIHHTVRSGIDGTTTTNFSFTNGKIANSGVSAANTVVGVIGDSNISFNDTAGANENNLSGIVTITNNQLSTGFYHGVQIFNFAGTISDATISNNVVTSATSTTLSLGSGIHLVAFGNASTAANVTKATINANQVNNFPSSVGIETQGGNATPGGPGGTLGTPGNATNVVAVTNNTISGQSAAAQIGAEGIVASVQGGNAGSRSQGNFDIGVNTVTHTKGTGISNSTFGFSTVTSTIHDNTIVANNIFASQGIGGGNGVSVGASDTPLMTVTVLNNNISQTDGNGILMVSRDTNGTLNLGIRGNVVAAPLAGVRPGIRIDSGNLGDGEDETVCLDISGNTSAGSGGHPGIGLRKQGTDPALHVFGIEGLSPSPTGTPNVESHVNTNNPAGNGTLLISATSGFTSCTTAP